MSNVPLKGRGLGFLGLSLTPISGLMLCRLLILVPRFSFSLCPFLLPHLPFELSFSFTEPIPSSLPSSSLPFCFLSFLVLLIFFIKKIKGEKSLL